MKVSELLSQSKGPHFSFEFFPPRGPSGEANLFKSISDLQAINPAYISVTCGAGGTTHRKTVEWAKRIQNEAHIEAVVHQTSYGLTVNDVNETLDQMSDAGLQNVLAIRGDVPKSGEVTQAFPYASDMIRHIKSRYPKICVLAGCYPEGHPEAASRQVDFDHLRQKVDAGVDVLVTQLFFDNRHFFDFLGRARSMGIAVPIIPGIMPIQNVDQIKRFTSTIGATIPTHLLKLLEQYSETPSAVFYIGVAHAIAQSHELLAAGVPAVHFYTLNKSPATRLVVDALKS